MVQKFIDAWYKNKDKVEEKLKENFTSYCSYDDLVTLVINEVINTIFEKDNGYGAYDTSKMTVIDDGDYQGTIIFIIPNNKYQPGVSDYIFTSCYYGSCSVCDTFQSIQEEYCYREKENAIKYAMLLCLHLIQNMNYLGGHNE